MKKPTLTPAERAASALVLAEIVSRPSFGVARLWISQGSGAVRSRSGYPTSVGLMCLLLELTWGAIVDRQTMALALENSGFAIAARSFGAGMAYELATNIQRSSLPRMPWCTERPNPERWAWARDDAPAVKPTLYRNLTRH